MIEDDKESRKEIKLPPLPDDAIEFPGMTLESLIDDKTNNEEGALPTSDDAPPPNLETFIDEEDNGHVIYTDDPTPTKASIEEEFDPLTVQNALDDFDEEGGMSKAKVAGPVALSEAKMEKIESRYSNDNLLKFNAGSVQNALHDLEVEGGIVMNKTTGDQKTQSGDVSKEGKMIKLDQSSSDPTKFRLYGFTVQYKEKNTSGQIVTKTMEVSDYYDSCERAMSSVNGGIYLIPNEDDTYNVVDIVSGSPCISQGDRLYYTYVTGKKNKSNIMGSWRRNK